MKWAELCGRVPPSDSEWGAERIAEELTNSKNRKRDIRSEADRKMLCVRLWRKNRRSISNSDFCVILSARSLPHRVCKADK